MGERRGRQRGRDHCLTIIDGGTLSNFPVWLFDIDPAVAGRPPARPTFGLTLAGGRGLGGRSAPLDAAPLWPVRLAVDIFHTAQGAWDKRFVSHSTRVRTIVVNAEDVATTEFDLPAPKRDKLLSNGRSAAMALLDQFSLADYLNTFHAGLGPLTAISRPEGA